MRAYYSSLPALPIVGPISLVLLAGFEMMYGFSVRSRLRNPGNRPLEPLFVAKLAVLAKASSHAAAIIAGLYGGFLVYTLTKLGNPRDQRRQPRQRTQRRRFACLVGAALFLEYSCRVPAAARRPLIARYLA